MCLLFETIKLKDGVFFNLKYHSERMNNARELLLNQANALRLKSVLTVPAGCSKGLYKCRVAYDYYIHKIEFIPYKPGEIKTLKIVYADDISYQFKFTDRAQLQKLKNSAGADDIIIVKNGLVTDTSFSNLIFCDRGKWITPSTPLLKGTKRQELLDRRIISEQEIKPSDLKMFSRIKLINAMRSLEDEDEDEIEVSG